MNRPKLKKIKEMEKERRELIDPDESSSDIEPPLRDKM
jgi:hypothetical protein